ncbi:related to siderophore iron transporter mirc [Ustilago trichophora]|uniref:Related to siderophore iron transporter mirc n=1 Tax=Ustilago trichophora TaxID=86804 RepID=A0A5C3E5Y5_9BASI|nr:related to siderophore iron transporter mirc [Ustilago trichophora]
MPPGPVTPIRQHLQPPRPPETSASADSTYTSPATSLRVALDPETERPRYQSVCHPKPRAAKRTRRHLTDDESDLHDDDDDEHDDDNDDNDEDEGGDFEDQRLLKSMSSLHRERNLVEQDPRALWRRRRGMYLLVYSAIFCVAYVTSLDSNTGYLYLNFACSEYGALASFSTVAIVQQMVFAIAKPPIAKLSDVVGRPQAYVLSLVLYVCGYMIVATTASLRGLIGGICLQSAGTTGIQVLQSIIIADTTTAKWRGLVIGIVNLPFLINFAVAGPMVDLVMRHGGWRFGFAIWTVIVPLAATPLLLTLLVGQRRARRAGLATRSSLTDKPWRQALGQLATELDLLGLLLFTGGWLLILLPLTLASHGERQAQVPMTTFILGGVGLLVVFGWWETRASVPILPYQFLTNSAVVCTCVVGVLDFASFYISWTFLSSFVQILKGWDQTKTGYFATTQNVTSTITGIVVGSLMAMTRRYKMLLMIGLVVRVLGVTLMVRYRTADDPTYMLVLCQLLQGIGGGSIAITMQVAVQVTVRHADVAIVTALELLTTEIGAAIGSATAGWMFQTYLPAQLQQNLPNMDADELKLVYGSLQKALSYPIGSDERTAIINSWVHVMRMLSIVATITLVPAVLFGLAIPDASLPDVHGAAQSHGHYHHHGSRRADRRSVRRRPSFLSSSRPSSPLEIRAGHTDITPGGGLGAFGVTERVSTPTGSKRSRSVSRNRNSEREARDEPNLSRKKRRARKAVLY